MVNMRHNELVLGRGYSNICDDPTHYAAEYFGQNLWRALHRSGTSVAFRRQKTKVSLLTCYLDIDALSGQGGHVDAEPIILGVTVSMIGDTENVNIAGLPSMRTDFRTRFSGNPCKMSGFVRSI